MTYNKIAIGASVLAFCLGVSVGVGGKQTGKSESVAYAYVVQVEDRLEAVDWNMTARECAEQLAAGVVIPDGPNGLVFPKPGGLCISNGDKSEKITP